MTETEQPTNLKFKQFSSGEAAKMTSNCKTNKSRPQREKRTSAPLEQNSRTRKKADVLAVKNLPLSRKSVYIDMKRGKAAELLEEQLVKLGARIESFLTADLNYVISSFGPSKADDIQKNVEGNPQSPANSVASPFSCIPSPSAPSSYDSKKAALTVSRGKALANLASKNQTSTVVKNAEKMGVKVISVEVASKWMERELNKLEKECPTFGSTAEKNLNKAVSPKKEAKTKSKVLKGNFLKFEAMNRHYRPVKSEMDKWPRINPLAPPGLCPFADSKAKGKQHSFVAHKGQQGHLSLGINNQTICGNKKVGTAKAQNVCGSKHQSPKKKQENNCVDPSKAHVPQEVLATPITIGGDVKRNNQTFKKNVNINKQQGYCDCCDVKFKALDKHLKGDEHQAFARDKSNYDSLDMLISQVPTTIKFLQAVLLTHCTMQRQNVKSSDPLDNRETASKVSPLQKHQPQPCTIKTPTETTVDTASAVVPLSLHTPKLCPVEVSPSRDPLLLLATDDFASKSQVETPTQGEVPETANTTLNTTLESEHSNTHNDTLSTVDQRPQAVVVRRPVPSGIFTSPRRQRPPTPNKTPRVMERSMIFRDSPIASLQPSPASGSPTFRPMVTNSGTPNTNQSPTKFQQLEDNPIGSTPNLKSIDDEQLQAKCVKSVSAHTIKEDKPGNIVNTENSPNKIVTIEPQATGNKKSRFNRKKDVVRRLTMEDVKTGDETPVESKSRVRKHNHDSELNATKEEDVEFHAKSPPRKRLRGNTFQELKGQNQRDPLTTKFSEKTTSDPAKDISNAVPKMRCSDQNNEIEFSEKTASDPTKDNYNAMPKMVGSDQKNKLTVSEKTTSDPTKDNCNAVPKMRGSDQKNKSTISEKTASDPTKDSCNAVPKMRDSDQKNKSTISEKTASDPAKHNCNVMPKMKGSEQNVTETEDTMCTTQSYIGMSLNKLTRKCKRSSIKDANMLKETEEEKNKGGVSLTNKPLDTPNSFISSHENGEILYQFDRRNSPSKSCHVALQKIVWNDGCGAERVSVKLYEKAGAIGSKDSSNVQKTNNDSNSSYEIEIKNSAVNEMESKPNQSNGNIPVKQEIKSSDGPNCHILANHSSISKDGMAKPEAEDSSKNTASDNSGQRSRSRTRRTRRVDNIEDRAKHSENLDTCAISVANKDIGAPVEEELASLPMTSINYDTRILTERRPSRYSLPCPDEELLASDKQVKDRSKEPNLNQKPVHPVNSEDSKKSSGGSHSAKVKEIPATDVEQEPFRQQRTRSRSHGKKEQFIKEATISTNLDTKKTFHVNSNQLEIHDLPKKNEILKDGDTGVKGLVENEKGIGKHNQLKRNKSKEPKIKKDCNNDRLKGNIAEKESAELTLGGRERFCKQFVYKGLFANSGLDLEKEKLDVVPNIAERVKSRSRTVDRPMSVCSADEGDVEEGCTSNRNTDNVLSKRILRRKSKTVQGGNELKFTADVEDLQMKFKCDEESDSNSFLSRSCNAQQFDSDAQNSRHVKSSFHDSYSKNEMKESGEENIAFPLKVVPNIAESVKRRRSCTLFNHPGLYANSGEGSDSEVDTVSNSSKSRSINYGLKSRSTMSWKKTDLSIMDNNCKTSTEGLQVRKTIQENSSKNERICKNSAVTVSHSDEDGSARLRASLVKGDHIALTVEPSQHKFKDTVMAPPATPSKPLHSGSNNIDWSDKSNSTLAAGNSPRTTDGEVHNTQAVVIRRWKNTSMPYLHKPRPDVDWSKLDGKERCNTDDTIQKTSCNQENLKTIEHCGQSNLKADHKVSSSSKDDQSQVGSVVIRRRNQRVSLPGNSRLVLENSAKIDVRNDSKKSSFGSPRIKMKIKKLPAHEGEGYSSSILEDYPNENENNLERELYQYTTQSQNKKTEKTEIKLSGTPEKSDCYSVDLLTFSPPSRCKAEKSINLEKKDSQNKHTDVEISTHNANIDRPVSPCFSSPLANREKSLPPDTEIQIGRSKSPVFCKKGLKKLKKSKQKLFKDKNSRLETSPSNSKGRTKKGKDGGRKRKRHHSSPGSSSPTLKNKKKVRRLASLRSMAQTINSEQEKSATSFHGFQVLSDEGIPSAVSFDNASQIPIDICDENSEKTLEYSPIKAENKEQENVSAGSDCMAYVPTLSSPGKVTDSSWGDVCESYLTSSVMKKGAHHVSNRQPRSPSSHHNRQSLLSPSKGAQGSSKSLMSPNKKYGDKTICCFTPTKMSCASPDRRSLRSPNKCVKNTVVHKNSFTTPIKQSPRQLKAESPNVRMIDRVVSFNMRSPQKLKQSPYKDS